eukprot:scaffold7364_cov130-Isochrysis_galbana.AAC.1
MEDILQFSINGGETPLDQLTVKKLTYLISVRHRKPRRPRPPSSSSSSSRSCRGAIVGLHAHAEFCFFRSI